MTGFHVELVLMVMASVITGVLSGGVSAFIAVKVVQNDVQWLKSMVRNLFERLHKLETAASCPHLLRKD